jgi:hypothetical protein
MDQAPRDAAPGSVRRKAAPDEQGSPGENKSLNADERGRVRASGLISREAACSHAEHAGLSLLRYAVCGIRPADRFTRC